MNGNPQDGAPVAVAVLGTGRMGAGIARLVREKPGTELVGVYGRRPRPAGTDAGEAIGLSERIGIPVDHDLGALLARVRPRIAIQATCSRLSEALPEICALVEAGADVISIAEQMAFPAFRAPAEARELDVLARRRRVTVLGTGVNPGFVLDLLVIALSGVCQRVDRIVATRVNDLAPFGPTVLESQGVGLTPEAFAAGVAAGTVTGHHGFPESMAMIAAALGWHLGEVRERREPIVSRVRRETATVTVEPGQVAGCRHTAVGFVDGAPRIELVHPQQVHPHLEGVDTCDDVAITGVPDVHLHGSPEIPGGAATVALAVNMIPHVLTAPAGLASMADLPVPAALMGDVRAIARARAPGAAA